MIKFIYSLIVCLLLSSIVYSGTIDPRVPDSKYIEYGKKFSYIGLLIGQKEDNTPYAGSVVAYKPRIIITAAHLFHKNKTCAAVFGEKTIQVEKIIIYPEYRYDKFGSHDIAVCILSEDIGLDWYPELYEQQDEIGKVVSMSGFGSSGTFITGVNKSGGIKRAGSNLVDGSNQYLLFCSPSLSLSKSKTSLEFLICPGDSGGGLFIGNKLAGIHSGVIEDKPNKGKSKYGAVSLHTRISEYSGWIKEIVDSIESEK